MTLTALERTSSYTMYQSTHGLLAHQVRIRPATTTTYNQHVITQCELRYLSAASTLPAHESFQRAPAPSAATPPMVQPPSLLSPSIAIRRRGLAANLRYPPPPDPNLMDSWCISSTGILLVNFFNRNYVATLLKQVTRIWELQHPPPWLGMTRRNTLLHKRLYGTLRLHPGVRPFLIRSNAASCHPLGPGYVLQPFLQQCSQQHLLCRQPR